SRVFGPALAGLLIKWLGEGPCFLINALSFIAVIGGLLTIRVRPAQTGPLDGSPIKNLQEGFHYVSRTRPVRALLLLIAFVSVFGLPYIVLMPIFASEVLAGGPGTLGVLMGAAGAGAFAGAFALAMRNRVTGLERIVSASVATFGV